VASSCWICDIVRFSFLCHYYTNFGGDCFDALISDEVTVAILRIRKVHFMPELEGDDWWRRPPISDDDDAESDHWESDDEDDSVARCPYCNEEIADEEIVCCPYCEKYLSKEDFRSPRHSGWVLWTAIVCFIVTIVSWFLFL
jgi:predicted nucleic acid-binding Zn ribbon protein